MIRTTVEMYDQYPEINGWSFWTWKKAPNKFPGLVTITVPGSWEPVMASVASLFGRNMPDQAKVRAGMRDFIEAVKLKNCDYDQRMEKSLLPKR
jgi:hypothetical protein